ncbi:hypothetical protein [Mucilaginibacter aquatilis]|uniref:DUF962 domain-containing protein n=1 Tax=Mucilaginibacter aquatilis TaxID=1517760 RepID=A0A6I4I9F9_9SPHI|nr:hypothetical protein [Mucilaginibacter aquatilis]MVN90096.1 hypothetical protein [Mucilaginibacter aquatilis]
MPPKAELRPVDKHFDEYSLVQKQFMLPVPVLCFAIVLTLFGLVTFIWALPFPYISFLGRYNGYINWASFLIAFSIYYLLRLSPLVSYVMLFMLFAFSYGIIQLEGWQKAGGPELWLVGLVALIVGLALQLLTYRSFNFNRRLRLLMLAPLWLIVSIIKKLNFKH